MLHVALGDDWSQARAAKLLAEGLDRYPDYTPIYRRDIELLLRGGTGTKDDIDALVTNAVRRNAARSGTQMYARLYTYMRLCGCDGDNLFATTRADWPRLRASFHEIAAAWSDPWIADEEFFFACEAGDARDAAAAFAGVDPDPQSRAPVWRTPGAFEACRAWARDPAAADGVSPLRAAPPTTSGAMLIHLSPTMLAMVFGVWLSLFAFAHGVV